jgi:hypothetical protein
MIISAPIAEGETSSVITVHDRSTKADCRRIRFVELLYAERISDCY